MKNVCLVFQKYAPVHNKIAETFVNGGYQFDEVRFYSTTSIESGFFNEFIGESSPYRAIAIIISPSDLAIIKDKLFENYTPNFSKTDSYGAGVYSNGAKTVFIVPDEKEYLPFAERIAFPQLTEELGVRYDKTVVRLISADKNRVYEVVNGLKTAVKDKIRIDIEESFDDYKISVFFDALTPKIFVDDIVRELLDKFGDNVYALDDTPIEERLVQILKLRSQTISVAESFTGGGVASKIVSVSGASEVYYEGLNTYHETAKMSRLGVSEFTLQSVGAVADKTAYEMAAGLIATGKCDLSVATTGLAGPNSDGSGLPVGLCFVAIGTLERVYVYKFEFDGSREEITGKAIRHALFLAYRRLKDI